MTIAIVDAYNAPNITSDLAAFSTAYGLPQMNGTGNPAFNVYYVGGGSNDHLVTRAPASNAGWATEISLDVEWAHAIAPQANIQLFEAAGADYSSLLNAIDWARYSGAQVVSMSFGGGEWSGETSWDAARFTSYPGKNVTFVASSGDSGSSGGAQWPSVSPNVVGVGGTTLNLSAGAYGSETAWSGSGGGQSVLEPVPAYQTSAQGSAYRQTPDVAYDANPSTGFAVYDTYQTRSAWAVYGGTSAGAPQWSALVAIADQGRALNGLSSLDGATQTLATLYGLGSPSSSFHDIALGSNGAYTAKTGYDMVTGLGTPVAQALVTALVTVPDAASSSVVVTAAATRGGGVTAHVVSVGPVVAVPTPGSSQAPAATVAVPLVAVANGSSIFVAQAASLPLVSPAPLTSSTASVTSVAQGTIGSNVGNVSILMAPAATPVLPPQSLSARPTFDRTLLLPRSSSRMDRVPEPAEEPDLFAPDTDVLTPLRLPRIELPADVADLLETPRWTPWTEPLLTDLDFSVGDETPAVDPALAGAMIAAGGVLAVRIHHSGNRRRWSLPRRREASRNAGAN